MTINKDCDNPACNERELERQRIRKKIKEEYEKECPRKSIPSKRAIGLGDAISIIDNIIHEEKIKKVQ